MLMCARFGKLNDLGGQMRRNEDNPGLGAQHHVARNTGRRADAGDTVDIGHGDTGNRFGVDAFDIGAEVGDLLDASQVAQPAINDHAAPAIGLDGGGQIIADEIYSAEEVGYQHVAVNHLVNDAERLLREDRRG